MNTITSVIKEKRFTIAWICQLSAISLYGLLGSLTFTFARPGLWVYAVCLMTGLGLELGLCKWLQKKPSPISALITGAACFLQLSSYYLLAFLATLTFAFLSKSFFRVKGTHIFNPANIGILTFLCLFPQAGVQDGMQWHLADPKIFSLFVFTLGMSIVVLANRWLLSISYILFFILACYIRQLVTNVDYTFFAMPLLGAGLLIYVFHMISDPVTTPSSKTGQIIFGGSVALIDQYLRHKSVFYSVLIALAIVSLARGIIIEFRATRVQTN